ncbi:MAG: hypothetical protein ACRD47_07990 [Nitrososphaeraceae archaeon]
MRSYNIEYSYSDHAQDLARINLSVRHRTSLSGCRGTHERFKDLTSNKSAEKIIVGHVYFFKDRLVSR